MAVVCRPVRESGDRQSRCWRRTQLAGRDMQESNLLYVAQRLWKTPVGIAAYCIRRRAVHIVLQDPVQESDPCLSCKVE